MEWFLIFQLAVFFSQIVDFQNRKSSNLSSEKLENFTLLQISETCRKRRETTSTKPGRLEKGKIKPGTAQIGAISKAQKDSKTTFSTTGDNKNSQKT